MCFTITIQPTPTCFALSRREAMELDIEGVFAAAAAAEYMAAP